MIKLNCFAIRDHSERKSESVSHLGLSTPLRPMNYSPPGSSPCGILQARILQWVAIPFSRGSSWPRDYTQVFCTVGRFFTSWTTREAWRTKPISHKVFQLYVVKFCKCSKYFCVFSNYWVTILYIYIYKYYTVIIFPYKWVNFMYFEALWEIYIIFSYFFFMWLLILNSSLNVKILFSDILGRI